MDCRPWRMNSGEICLRKDEAVLLPCRAWRFCLAILIGIFSVAANAAAQTAPENAAYARRNTFGIFVAYSNDSSPMLMGVSDRRKLFDVGASYGRRILMNHFVNWQYNGELLPVALESDPLGRIVVHQTAPTNETTTVDDGPPLTCSTQTIPYSFVGPKGVTYSATQTFSCHGRQWTIGEAMSPVGFQWNFRPMHTLQPFLIGHGGYMYSTRPIPVPYSGSFNFAFDFGAGLELYRTKTRSIRAEYRYHHISNHGTAMYNPGIDNGLFQITYAFGR